MSKYEKVKNYFDNGLWSLNRVADAVTKGWITEAEYYQITGDDKYIIANTSSSKK